ncbi:interleukin-15 receptor subunit alpha isoform X2 [Choloepus didactylus]|uniref:interleukin-15 receptor subunit alpha isoform X2 n=1 Tax=Choloepus didactylus TaxID=27675 RepID=UPI00189EFE11|nr:interleukin-15 receptor subunit alpha isoform X2 [Choloepus didactylus]
MTPRRLRGGGVDAGAALLLLLLLLLRRPLELHGITCPTPTSVEHADIQVKSYNLSSRERYTCHSGFKRKAGTSSLTECVFNTTTNAAHWTTPSLRCIQPDAFSPKSDSTVTTGTALVPGSRLTPSKPPAGTTGVVSKGASKAPSQTTAKTLEQTPSTSNRTPGAHPYNSRVVAVAVPTSTVSVILLSGICVALFWARYRNVRSPSQTPSVEMENMEDAPMTGGTDGREEDIENYPYNL